MSTSDSSRLPAVQQTHEPVYLTRQAAAWRAGVHDHTISKYCRADAWRLERDGKLSPLYSLATVEAFRASYRDGRRAVEL